MFFKFTTKGNKNQENIKNTTTFCRSVTVGLVLTIENFFYITISYRPMSILIIPLIAFSIFFWYYKNY